MLLIKAKQSRAGYCPLMPQGAPPSVFLLFYSGCFYVLLSVLKGRECSWDWRSFSGEAVCLLPSASFDLAPFPLLKRSCTQRAELLQSHLDAYIANILPFHAVTGPVHGKLFPAEKCRQTNNACLLPGALADSPA